MLSEELKQEIQAAYSAFLNARELKARYGQRLMIAHIARNLGQLEIDSDGRRRGGKPLCVVEAGTGTGKTLAYMVAAIPLARAQGKTLVVATATVALQEQIIHRDLPDIARHSGLDFSFALAKGRRRYLCLSRLDQWLSGADHQTLALYPDEQALAPDSDTLALYQEMAQSLASGEWDGDRDQWSSMLAEDKWQRVTTDNAGCTGRRCSHIKNCPYFRAREEIVDADVVVANHDLVLADLALGGGVILPPPEDAIYVVDEAHHLPDKVINHFSHRLRFQAGLRWLEQTERSLGSMLTRLDSDSSLRAELDTLATRLASLRLSLAGIRPLLDGLLQDSGVADGGSAVLRFEDGVVPEPLRGPAAAAAAGCWDVVAEAEHLVEGLQKQLDSNQPVQPREELEQWLALVSGLQQRAESQAGLWTAYSADAREERPPQARWLQLVEGGGQLDIELNCSPILAAGTLDETLWPRCHAAVLTSATLTALGNFDRFAMRAGLADNAAFEVVPSPFNHAEKAELHLPAMRSDPGDARAHTAELVELLPEIIDLKEGTLVLFASRRQMEQVYDELPEAMRQSILMQGRQSKLDILRRHGELIDKGVGSIIFGLASFAEGVDLPGKRCSHVVIAKIPFAVPDDPVEQALAEWIEHNNGNAFMEVTVPDAALRLVQASGRLLRSEGDSGRITLLDRRLVTRRYGKRMLESLPPYKRIIG